MSDVNEKIARQARRADAWKAVYERMLACESAQPGMRRSVSLELARALRTARHCEADCDHNEETGT